MKICHKLVRARIPKIIEANSKACVIAVLSNDDYIALFDTKLEKKLRDYYAGRFAKELADLFKVLHSCVVAHGYTLEQFENVCTEKAAKHGAFTIYEENSS